MLRDRLFRSLIQSGRLEVTWPDGKRSVYQGKEPGDRHSAVRITDKRTSWAILRNPSLGAGEAFMDGRIVIEDGDIRQLLDLRSEEHTSELQSLMRISYAVFCLKKKKNNNTDT